MSFLVGLTDDLFNSRGEPTFGPAALSILDDARPLLEWRRISEPINTLTSELLANYDAIYVSVRRSTRLGHGKDWPGNSTAASRRHD